MKKALIFAIVVMIFLVGAVANAQVNLAPSLSVTASTVYGQAPLLVVFSAYGVDPEGEDLAYYWDFNDGSTSTEQNSVHTFMIPGTYTVNAVVSDGAGNTAVRTKTIAVESAINLAPSVSMSISRTNGDVPFTVVCSAFGIDPEGEDLTYYWDFGDGTVHSDAQTAVHTYTTSGTFSITVAAVDPNGNSGTNSKIVYVGTTNLAPSASMSASIQNGEVPLTVAFSGFGVDPEGEDVNYYWDFGDDATSTAQNPVHTYENAGTYTAILIVTDNVGNMATASKQIAVLPDNGAPSVSIIAEPETGVPPLTVVFRATGYDPEGEQLTYYWDFDDGSSALGQTVVHTFTYVNSYEVRVSAQDSNGNTATSTKIINVGPGLDPIHNVPPIAIASANPDSGYAPLVVTFTGMGEDADGEIVSYYWNFGDGAASSEQNPVHTFMYQGIFDVQFIVTDDDGATAIDSVQINVGQGFDGLTNIQLVQGWNLISLPIMPENTDIEVVLGAIDYTSIWRWNQGVEQWESYLSSLGGDFNTVEAGRGYWIYSNIDQVLSVSGIRASSQSLQQGWNLAGYGPESRTVQDSLSEININSVWRWGNERWESYLDDIQGGDFDNLEPGRGYWIYAESSGTWTY